MDEDPDGEENVDYDTIKFSLDNDELYKGGGMFGISECRIVKLLRNIQQDDDKSKL